MCRRSKRYDNKTIYVTDSLIEEFVAYLGELFVITHFIAALMEVFNIPFGRLTKDFNASNETN
jgi:hypothetical protein